MYRYFFPICLQIGKYTTRHQNQTFYVGVKIIVSPKCLQGKKNPKTESLGTVDFTGAVEWI